MYYLLAIVDVFVSSFAQMLLKSSSNDYFDSIVREYFNCKVIGAYSLMGVAGILNIYAMNRGLLLKEMSIIETLSYLFIPLLSFVCFREKIGYKKFLSILVIILGIIIFFS